MHSSLGSVSHFNVDRARTHVCALSKVASPVPPPPPIALLRLCLRIMYAPFVPHGNHPPVTAVCIPLLALVTVPHVTSLVTAPISLCTRKTFPRGISRVSANLVFTCKDRWFLLWGVQASKREGSENDR